MRRWRWRSVESRLSALDSSGRGDGALLQRALDSLSHDSALQDDFELIPHDPVSSGQLFVLVIDGSGSMYENDGERAKKVYDALMNPADIKGFLPEDNGGTGVVLLRFAKEVSGLDGKPPRVIRTAGEYRKMIREHLLVPHGGFTHLYDAVAYALKDLPNEKAIERFTAVKAAEPDNKPDAAPESAKGSVPKDGAAPAEKEPLD